MSNKGKSMRKRGPLRNIVDYEKRIVSTGYDHKGDYTGPEVTVTYEVLECGHKQLIKQDIYGETVAVRRRCAKCG